MQTTDCTDIKVLLSGLVDDELDHEIRHGAERHLAQCAACRALLDEAETLDKLVHVAMTSTIERQLPESFEQRVLNQTVFRQEQTHYLRQWTTWTGWIAAAAAVGLALTLFLTRTAPSTPAAPALEQQAGIAPAPIRNVYTTGHEFRSMTLKLPAQPSKSDPLADPRLFGRAAGTVSYLQQSDADDLYRAAMLLRMIEDPRARHTGIAHVRETVVYDELLPRLQDLSYEVTAAERETVRTAVSFFNRITEDDLQPAQLDLLGTLSAELSIADTLDRMSDRWEQSGNL